MQNIFISYRRDDASDVTGRIADVLKEKLGEEVLFKDVDSIPLGTDFRRVIADAVGRCDVLLAIIGDDWLNATDEARGRRIDDPNDFVQVEIRTRSPGARSNRERVRDSHVSRVRQIPCYRYAGFSAMPTA
jgi:hypothetical protein